MLWPDSLEETARSNLRHALWQLRKSLSASPPKVEYLLTDDLSITFNASAEYWLDVAELEKLSERVSTDELIYALSVYQGELLPGFYDEWVVLEREHLYSVFEHHMARLMSLLQDEKRWLDILEWGERWIKLGQKPELAYRALMTAHAAKGDMSKVAGTYERCVKSLRELGIEPSEQTKALYESLKVGKPTFETESTVHLPLREKRKEFPKTNLPMPLTSFIGREKEIEEIVRLLGKHRLVTLTGTGGVGKTRLAIESGKKLISRFKDGVWWVELAAIADPALVPQTVAKVVDVREVPNRPLTEILVEHFRSKQILLVLDNCEHLINACAQLVDSLLSACKNLKILATSREALDILGETAWPAPSLSLPKLQEAFSMRALNKFESVRLFTDRAILAQSKFELTNQNANPVVQICNRLSGMPLAIELAAARVKMMSVDEIAKRLDDCFDLLTAGSRTALPRHQTLRATIDWSHDLLSEPERILFRRLSVFAGGFTLEAAEAICSLGELERSDVLDLLGRLIDKSLVIVETASERDETRYRLLETIRQYALEKLTVIEEAREIRDRHSEFFVNWVEAVEPHIFGIDSGTWFKRLDKELENVRAAMDWSTNNGNPVNTLRIAGAIGNFWFVFVWSLSPSEWHHRVRQALSRPEGLERTVARAKALNGIGFLDWVDMYPTDIRLELEEALEISREHRDHWNVAAALRNLGLFANVHGTFLEARTFLLQSLEAWREMVPVNKMEIGRTLMFLGDAALTHDETEQARSFFEESIEIWRDFEDQNLMAWSVRRLGQLALRGGDDVKALRLCKESLSLNQNTGDFRGMLACLAGFGTIATAQGNFERATLLISAVASQLALTGIRLLPVDEMDLEKSLAILRVQMDERNFATFWARGKETSFDHAIALALEEI